MLSIKKAEKSLFSRPRNPWYLTVLIFLFSYAFVRVTQYLIGNITPPDGIIIDRLQILTTPINQFFHQHPLATNTVLITTSLWIDAGVIFLCMRALFGPTIRPFLELLLFALYRQTLQFLVSLPIPQEILWRYPGFPSLLADYSVLHDLYFSAHTGISLLVAMELVRTGKKWLDFLGFGLFAYVITTLISFRIHYTMDIFTAIFVVLYIIYTSEKLSIPVDRFLQSLQKNLKNKKPPYKTD